jgi:hypothetical protein
MDNPSIPVIENWLKRTETENVKDFVCISEMSLTNM